MGCLDNKVALVTGAARGIGRGIVEALAAEGASVIGFDLDEPEDDPIQRNVRWVRGDVTRRGDLEAALATGGGQVDIAVCNAGFLRYQPFLELDDETWQAHVDVDLTGVFRTAQTAARRMRDTGSGGSIIVITSVSAETPSRTQGHYCAAKAGAQMLAEAMAWELGEYGIRVNTVGPGWVETRLTADYLAEAGARAEVERTIPLGRVGQPRDIADAVVFLASDAASYITGARLRIDGGLIIGRDKT